MTPFLGGTPKVKHFYEIFMLHIKQIYHFKCGSQGNINSNFGWSFLENTKLHEVNATYTHDKLKSLFEYKCIIKVGKHTFYSCFKTLRDEQITKRLLIYSTHLFLWVKRSVQSNVKKHQENIYSPQFSVQYQTFSFS